MTAGHRSIPLSYPRPRTRLAMFCILLGLLGGAASALAASNEILVEGEVVDVVPIMTTRSVPSEAGDCAPAVPSDRGDVLALLRWDLRADCEVVWREERQVEGWRVYYRWDGEVYSRVMDAPPGETVSLRLTLH